MKVNKREGWGGGGGVVGGWRGGGVGWGGWKVMGRGDSCWYGKKEKQTVMWIGLDWIDGLDRGME